MGRQYTILVGMLRLLCSFRWITIATAFLALLDTGDLRAQTNLYFNNTIPGTRNWGGSNGGNGFWATTPSGGTFRTITTLGDVANFSTDASLVGTTDIFTGAGQAAYGLNFGVGPNAAGPFRIRASFNTNTTRTITLGAGGITVNANVQGVTFSNRDVVSGNLTGELNTELQASQTWTNNSSSPLDFGGRLVGTSAVSLTKSGTGTLILSGNNASAVVGNSTGMNGKILVNQGILKIGHANALGFRDLLTTANSSAAIGTLNSDTTIASGATLDTAGFALGSEFVTVSGAGMDGNGAIVNSAGVGDRGTFQQVQLAGNTTFGGFGYWDIRTPTEGQGRLFQDGHTLTKTGSSYVGLFNTKVLGGGDINITAGSLAFEAGTELTGTGTVRVGRSGTAVFSDNSGSITRPFIIDGGSIQSLGLNSVSNIDSNFLFIPPSKESFIQIHVDDDVVGVVGTLNLRGQLTGTGDIAKNGRGTLGINPNGYLGTIQLNEGGIDLNGNYPNQINILANGRATLGGEGQTSGKFQIQTTEPVKLTFDPTTTGLNEHLRVGSLQFLGSPVELKLRSPINSGSGIVVIESAANDITTSMFTYNGRGSLRSTSSQLLFDYQAGNLTWRGNDSLNASVWNEDNQNWLNIATATSDVFFQDDSVVFDDSVGGGSTLVQPRGTVAPSSILFNNSAVNFTVTPDALGGRVQAPGSLLTKDGTGLVMINTIQGVSGHSFGPTDVKAGILEFGYTGGGTAVTSSLVSTIIRSGATLRNSLASTNMGIGENPIAIEPGGSFELTRGATPNGTNAFPGVTAMRSQFSGAGDIRLRGVSGPGFVDSFGDYIIAADNSGFSGKWFIENARVRADNAQGDELGTASVKVVQGGQIYLNTNAATPYEGNTFEIEGTGWAFEPAANGAYGAMRFQIAGATIGASSSVILTNNARISAQNIASGVILAPISGNGTLEYGNPTATQNGNLIIGGRNTYNGNTTIENHLVMANHNSAFSNGTVAVNGYTTSRITQLAIGNGIEIGNDVVVGTFAGQNARAAIEGGSPLQIPSLGAGVGTISGTIQLLGIQEGDRGHFGSGGGIGSALRVTGSINMNDPDNNPVSHRSSSSNGYTQFENGAGNYTKFDLKGGTVRLGTDNGLRSGIELLTRTAAAEGTFDLHGFNQTVSRVASEGAVGGSSFQLINTATTVSTLMITGIGDSDIASIPSQAGIVNILKEGPGALMLSGTTAGLGNAGDYIINGGSFRVADGQRAGASLILNDGSLLGNGIIAGNSSIAGGTLSPGASTGHLRFERNLVLRNDTNFVFEIASTAGFENTFHDFVTVGGTLDLLDLDRMTIDVIGLASNHSQGMINPSVFDPLQNDEWTIFDTSSAIPGFDANDFAINTTTLTIHNFVGGTFSVGLGNGNTDVVLRYVAPVPEPCSFAMLAAGLGIIGFRRIHGRDLASVATD